MAEPPSVDPGPRYITPALAQYMFQNTNPLSPAEGAKLALQEAMWKWAGIVRTEDGLGRALAEIERLRASAREAGTKGGRVYNHEWYEAIDLPRMLAVAEALVRSRRWRLPGEVAATT